MAEGRINGSLNLSRALGDMDYKQSKDLGPDAQMVTAVPEVRSLRLEPGDEFLILACDGIWDVLSNQQARPCRHTSRHLTSPHLIEFGLARPCRPLSPDVHLRNLQFLFLVIAACALSLLLSTANRTHTRARVKLSALKSVAALSYRENY